MSEIPSVTLTIDGKRVSVPQGTTVLQACERVQSPVPFYCYHPGLSIAGNCRICLVEIEGMNKLQISCNIPVKDGMVVNTNGDQALEGRQQVLEFLLINHPLDCPVCDQAGECWLQDYYMEHGLYDPKFNEEKIKKPKAVPIGPTVMLDAERCILCSRCVRFTDEVSKTGEFGIFNRGDHAEIGLQEGKLLENNYSGNVVDICPVGALTDRDFRFKCRVWYLGSTKSVCPGCSKGCNIEIHHNRERRTREHIAEGARIMRLKPRYNEDVNKWWMCDVGRYGYKSIDENRIEQVRVKQEGVQWDGEWEEAFERLGSRLSQLRDEQAMGQVALVLSSQLTNEDLYAAKRFARELKITQISFIRPKLGESDDLLMQKDKSPNARGAEALGIVEDAENVLKLAAKGKLKVLIIFSQDLCALFGKKHVEAALANVELSVFIGTQRNPTADLVDLVLPSAVYAEKDGTFTNSDGRVQRIRAAVEPWAGAKSEWEILKVLSLRLGLELESPDAPALFLEMAKHEPAFRGLSYDAIGDQGAPLSI